MNGTKETIKKPWGGRFQEATNKLLENFSASIQYDRRLYRQDIAGSKAHASMLARQGIISDRDADAIVKGLTEIEKEIRSGKFVWRPGLEDIHMNIEQALVERIGEAGKRLHTGRSRNDQVATDVRLYLREEIDHLDGLLLGLQQALLSQARAHQELILPGYTHMQRAQPVLWPHHMLAYFEMFKRDRERLKDCKKRTNICPLGSAALAGTGFPIDRVSVADELGFEGITANSMDAVSDRDFVIEFLAAASIIMAHLSRLSEELVLWSSSEFQFVDLPDSLCTGSSIMPQKKNPDAAELVRGKTGRVYGHLIGLLTTMKGLPLAYNRDLQEDKEALFDSIDTVCASVEIMSVMVAEMEPRERHISGCVTQGFLTATDLADYLVGKGLPFRKAHSVVGKIVFQCLSQGRELTDLGLDELRAFSPLIDGDIFEVLSVEGSVRARRCPGGTAPERVAEALARAEKEIN
ncbi:MAG: argininosuccinate lyase [Nitrospiraceae bacterium]|nr:argininosuccinate lyase [Nitrospiraceae bacterium]